MSQRVYSPVAPVWRAPAIEAGLFCLVLGVPVAIGGVHRGVQLAAALLACATFFTLWVHRRAARRALYLPWFATVLCALTGYTLLQTIPLPMPLLRWLAPSTVTTLALSLSSLEHTPGWHPISLDPGATLWETLKLGTCALTFIIAHNWMRKRPDRVERLLTGLSLAGAALVMIGLLGAVAAQGRPLLFYVPQSGEVLGLISTSFVNPNHGAAFLILCTCASMGLALSAPNYRRAAMFGISATLTGTGACLTLSRGGVIALAAGLLINSTLVVLHRRRNREQGMPFRRAVWIPAGLAAIMGLSALLGYDVIIGEFARLAPEEGLSLGKIALWGPGLKMALDNPWVGVGRGAFVSAFPRYLDHSPALAKTHTYLENEYLQVLIDWGLPVGLFAIIATGAALLYWMRRGERFSPKSAAAAAGLIAVGVHNLFDFNLEILGLALPALGLAAVLSSRTPMRDKKAAQSPRLMWSAVALVLLLCGWVTFRPNPEWHRDDRALMELMSDRQRPQELAELAREQIRRRPADYVPHWALSRALMAQGQTREAFAELNRALFLNPGSPELHLETAAGLIRTGRPQQALVEGRLALDSGMPTRRVLNWGLPLCKSLADLVRLLPAKARYYADAIRALTRAKRRALAAALATQARSEFPDNSDLAALAVKVQLLQPKPGDAVAAAQRLAAKDPSPGNLALVAAAQTAAGRSQDAVETLTQARKRHPADLSLAFALARTHLARNELDPAKTVAEAALRQAGTPRKVAEAHELLARILSAGGRVHRARYESMQAQRIRQNEPRP